MVTFYFRLLVIKILSYSIIFPPFPLCSNLSHLVPQCLMPECFEPQIEGVSEAALKERIKLKKVKASVDMFDQLLQAGDQVHRKLPPGMVWAVVT